jgi:spore germination protein
VPPALGYLPWWIAPGWKELPLAKLERLVLFDAPVSQDGGVQRRDWPSGITASGIELAITLFEQVHFDALFSEPDRRARLLAQTVELLAQPLVGGLQLDIEGYAPATPAALVGFRDWLARLDERRRTLGKSLSAFFPASDSFTPYDAPAARRIDYFVAQLYDAHWPGSKRSGPLVTRRADNAVAVPRALARLAALGVPRDAVLLSIPLYGWEWPTESERPGAAATGRGRLVTYAETPVALMPNDRLAAMALVRQHGLRRDEEDTPYYAYRDGAQWRQGWFEDLYSLTRKLAPERGASYGGLAFFPLGYDRGEIVETMLRWWNAPR